jgi:hypothetical protein
MVPGAWRSIIRQVSRCCVTCNGAARRADDTKVLEDTERLIAGLGPRTGAATRP